MIVITFAKTNLIILMKINIFLVSCCIAIAIAGCTGSKDNPSTENGEENSDPSKISNTEIWYTTTDGQTISPLASAFNASIVSNTYTGGKGIIKFSTDVTKIGTGAFERIEHLSTIELPSSIKLLGGSAFKICEELKSIDIKEGVEKIGDQCFNGCLALTEITIPKSVKAIDYSAFQYSGLVKLNFLEGLEFIGEFAFDGCTALTEVKIPDSVTVLDQEAFNNCTSLKKAILSNGMSDLRDFTFSGCSALTDVTIPENITSIKIGAFFNCTGLKTITIPSKVIEMGSAVLKTVQVWNRCIAKLGLPLG